MYIPDTEPALASDPTYSPMSAVPALFAVAFNTTAICDDHTISLPSVPSVHGRTLAGIGNFLTELQALGTNPTAVAGGLPCTQTVTCSTSASAAEQATCEAANKLPPRAGIRSATCAPA